MSYDWNPPAEDMAALRRWFDTWGPLVDAVDVVPARALFDDNIAAFGTRMDVVEGLDHLESNQWRNVWPTIEDFRFHTDGMRAGVSPDGLMAVALCTWSSTGRHPDGTAFDRPGRATVVFARVTREAAWTGIHTHISLNPGTPQTSHGQRRAKS